MTWRAEKKSWGWVVTDGTWTGFVCDRGYVGSVMRFTRGSTPGESALPALTAAAARARRAEPGTRGRYGNRVSQRRELICVAIAHEMNAGSGPHPAFGPLLAQAGEGR